MTRLYSRRDLIVQSGACLGVAAGLGAAVDCVAAQPASPPAASSVPLRYCLNLSTIRGQKLSLAEQVEVAAKAGYQAIEPWVNEIQRYAESGGSLEDLRKRIEDLGLSVESAIGFADWINEDEAKRRIGLEQMQRDMELVARIGGKRIAAPPSGAYKTPGMDLSKIADRYRALLALGRRVGVVPQLEIWGGSMTLRRLSEAAYVVVEAAEPDACVLLDAYQLYKGGSDFAGLRLLNGAAMHVLHMNDYPADPPRAELTDAHRVYPGDGVAPLVCLVRTLCQTGFRGFLSLELFNRQYWQQDALVVARTGLDKMRAVVEKAG